MIETSLYTGDSFAQGARLCLKHRLYVSGWQLSPLLMHLISYPGDARLAVAFDSAAPVALVLLSRGMAMAFCKASHRRRGFASAAFMRLSAGPETHAEEGTEGSLQFWHKQNIVPQRYW